MQEIFNVCDHACVCNSCRVVRLEESYGDSPAKAEPAEMMGNHWDVLCLSLLEGTGDTGAARLLARGSCRYRATECIHKHLSSKVFFLPMLIHYRGH